MKAAGCGGTYAAELVALKALRFATAEATLVY
jgi:hypothetical protein